MHRQAANDEGITSPFAQLFIMGAFVHELALGCQHVVGPRLLDMDERPLSSTEREVLDTRQASKGDDQAPALPPVRVKVLGDGPDREKLEALAAQLDAPADFLGYTAYELMAAYLCASDIVVNSLVTLA